MERNSTFFCVSVIVSSLVSLGIVIVINCVFLNYYFILTTEIKKKISNIPDRTRNMELLQMVSEKFEKIKADAVDIFSVHSSHIQLSENISSFSRSLLPRNLTRYIDSHPEISANPTTLSTFIREINTSSTTLLDPTKKLQLPLDTYHIKWPSILTNIECNETFRNRTVNISCILPKTTNYLEATFSIQNLSFSMINKSESLIQAVDAIQTYNSYGSSNKFTKRLLLLFNHNRILGNYMNPTLLQTSEIVQRSMYYIYSYTDLNTFDAITFDAEDGIGCYDSINTGSENALIQYARTKTNGGILVTHDTVDYCRRWQDAMYTFLGIRWIDYPPDHIWAVGYKVSKQTEVQYHPIFHYPYDFSYISIFPVSGVHCTKCERYGGGRTFLTITEPNTEYLVLKESGNNFRGGYCALGHSSSFTDAEIKMYHNILNWILHNSQRNY